MILKIVGIKEFSEPDLQASNVAALAGKTVTTKIMITSTILRNDILVTKIDKKILTRNYSFKSSVRSK